MLCKTVCLLNWPKQGTLLQTIFNIAHFPQCYMLIKHTIAPTYASLSCSVVIANEHILLWVGFLCELLETFNQNCFSQSDNLAGSQLPRNVQVLGFTATLFLVAIFRQPRCNSGPSVTGTAIEGKSSPLTLQLGCDSSADVFLRKEGFKNKCI